VYAAGIPFTLVQIVAWYALNFAGGGKSFPADVDGAEDRPEHEPPGDEPEEREPDGHPEKQRIRLGQDRADPGTLDDPQ
jgi:hypothetical protein